MPITRIALVGHCGFDSGPLSRFAGQLAPQAEVVRVNDQQSLDAVAGADALLLVNRVLDGRFDAGGSGLDLIRHYAAQDAGPATMLVSNYDDAQQEARALGALPGFGKSQVGDRATLLRIARAVAAADQRA